MSSFDRLSHFKSIFDNFLHRPNFLKIHKNDILGPDQGKLTIYGSNFQQVNLTTNGGVSPTVIGINKSCKRCQITLLRLVNNMAASVHKKTVGENGF